MAAEFERWAEEKIRLAQELRRKGFEQFASDLEVQAQEDFAMANKARAQGMPEHFLPEAIVGTPLVCTEMSTYHRDLRMKYEGVMEQREFLTPDFQTKFWRDIYAEIGPSLAVPECDWSEEEIREPMIDVNGRRVDTMFVYHPATGFVKTEATLNTPNDDTTESDITNHLENYPRYKGADKSTYLPLGYALFVLTGEYPDIRNFSRLPGEIQNDRMVVFSYCVNGAKKAVERLGPKFHSQGLGARFIATKPPETIKGIPPVFLA